MIGISGFILKPSELTRWIN